MRTVTGALQDHSLHVLNRIAPSNPPPPAVARPSAQSLAMQSSTFAMAFTALLACVAVPSALGVPSRHLLQNRKPAV